MSLAGSNWGSATSVTCRHSGPRSRPYPSPRCPASERPRSILLRQFDLASALGPKAAYVCAFNKFRIVPIVFSNESRGVCSVPERLCDADGDAVLFVLDGTRWGELGTGWLGCKPQSADQIDRMLQNRRHHPFPPSGALPLGSLSRPLLCLSDSPTRPGSPCRPAAWRA